MVQIIITSHPIIFDRHIYSQQPTQRKYCNCNMFSAQFQLKYEKYLVQVGGKRPPETSFRLWLNASLPKIFISTFALILCHCVHFQLRNSKSTKYCIKIGKLRRGQFTNGIEQLPPIDRQTAIGTYTMKLILVSC